MRRIVSPAVMPAFHTITHPAWKVSKVCQGFGKSQWLWKVFCLAAPSLKVFTLSPLNNDFHLFSPPNPLSTALFWRVHALTRSVFSLTISSLLSNQTLSHLNLSHLNSLSCVLSLSCALVKIPIIQVLHSLEHPSLKFAIFTLSPSLLLKLVSQLQFYHMSEKRHLDSLEAR